MKTMAQRRKERARKETLKELFLMVLFLGACVVAVGVAYAVGFVLSNQTI